MAKQFVPLAIATVLIVAGMLYQGKHTERWEKLNTELLTSFTENLLTVPKEFGEWTSVETPLSPEEFKRTDCTQYVSRLYSNSQGQKVSVYSVVGIARHVTMHSPDWCYVGAGFNMEGEAQPYTIQVDGQDHEFTTATFIKETNEGTNRIRIFWSYTDDGKWLGPTSAKSYFAGKPALCKMYLITEITADDNDRDSSPSIQFAKDFIPVLNRELLRQSTKTVDAA